MSQQIEELTSNEANPVNEKASILVIDDDPDTVDLICTFLKPHYDCDFAYDGEQAVALLLEKEYSVVLVDLMMPIMDGYTLTSCVTAISPLTPVIVVSGVADVQSAIKAMKTGAFDYIVKPFELEQVEVSIQRALRYHRVVQESRRNEQMIATYAVELANANEGLSKALTELDSTYSSTISALVAALETRNVETRGHSDRVVIYSLRLGRELGLDEKELKSLELGALFHDIGKIGIEDKILLKPMHLSSEEWKEMRKHPEKGMRIIEGIPHLRGALPVVAQHHERWDGRGYPMGYAGEEIDLKARIFAVADAIDAVTSNRPYDGPRSFEEAHRELRSGAGKQFDPKVVEAFERIPLEEWACLTRGVKEP
ncbi:MAG TPA: HD domain-containing phosphohydrolase [Blastocatellia bacterium]|nr:HD domain-containing phosphohydrolase [Blastocatellia bacterium]